MAKQVAIITGAGGGIGRATAVELARLGFIPVLIGRTIKTLRETAKLVEDSLIVRADITKPAQVDTVVGKTLKRFKRIDAIVNNAGVAPVLPIEKTNVKIWRQVIDTNLSSAFYLCRAAWSILKKQRSGVIVNISSMSAKDPFPGFLAYGAAKAGLNTLTISLAREGVDIGVRTYCIAPGAVETTMLRKILSPQQLSSDNTLAPQAVAEVIGRCIGGDPRYISGETIWLAKN
ncbi:MAG TPA: SDR family oxidoreductase [Tepidisphaeraceae bacterium]|nr:SDR family oxidoreductase [Tepidisphaeraceae bacterium]